MTLPYPRLDPGGLSAVAGLLAANLAVMGAQAAFGWAMPGQARLVVGTFHDAFATGTIPWAALPRLISHGFAHISVAHLAFNMVPLVVLGWLTARRVGGLGLVLLYLGLMVLGVVGYIAVMPPNVAVLGASGAVHGLAGLWVVWAWIDRRGVAWRALPSALWVGFIALVHLVLLRTFGAGFAWQLHATGIVAGMALAPFIAARRTQ